MKVWGTLASHYACECKDGWMTNPDGRCIKCALGCNHCNVINGLCDYCEENYWLTSDG